MCPLFSRYQLHDLYLRLKEDSTSVISSVPPHDPKDQAEPSDLSLQSLDEHSIEKKGGSTLSLSSLGKTFSQRVRRKSTNIYKKVLG